MKQSEIPETSKKLTLEDVQAIQFESDVCMWETLATIPATGLTLEEAFKLYINSLQWSDGDHFYRKTEDDLTEELFADTEEYTRKIICTCCGGTNIACDGVVNPNTGQMIDIGDEAFVDGRCQQCGHAVLSNVETVLAGIEEKYYQFKKRNTCEPLFADCEIAYCDRGAKDINKTIHVIIKLSPEIVEAEDDKIFFYCQDYAELKTFIHPAEGREFVIIDCSEIN